MRKYAVTATTAMAKKTGPFRTVVATGVTIADDHSHASKHQSATSRAGWRPEMARYDPTFREGDGHDTRQVPACGQAGMTIIDVACRVPIGLLDIHRNQHDKQEEQVISPL